MPDTPGRKFVKDVISGTAGGLAVVAVGHPFDTLKVRLQTQPTVNPIYSGFLDAARKTVQWEGLSGLYKGVSSPLAGQMFFRMTLFSAFGGSKRWLSTNPDGSTRPLVTSDFYKAGAMTGFAAAFAESPVDFYKSQVQVQIIRSKSNPDYKPAFTKVLDCVRQSFRYNGLKGPFQGLGATLIRNVPANSVYLGSFEVMKREVAKRQDKPVSQLHPAVVVALGGLGGIFYWMTIFPVDAVKSAMQTDDLRKPERKFPTMASAVKQLYAEGGIGRFYKGFTPAIIRAAPANGVMLATVDKVTYWLADK
jgi:solute carrier family 25 carnitine/acylcarnitine transporter 20/29